MLWDKKHDTKAILGWSTDTVVIAFRGTASISNVLADLQARTPPPWAGDALLWKLICMRQCSPKGMKIFECHALLA